MRFNKQEYKDAVVRSVNGNYSSYDNDDFGISEEDLPGVEKMSNEQEVVDGMPTRTVTEERQKMVPVTKINKFAIFGLVIGLLIAVLGVLVVLNIPKQIGLDIDDKLGYVLAVMGAYMFCSFGMHIKQKEFTIETYTVEKQVPVEAIPYKAEFDQMSKREEEMNTKVNDMTEMFNRLAMLTSDLEEKIMQREAEQMKAATSEENSEMVAKAAASAVLAALNAEKAEQEALKSAEESRLYEELQAVKAAAENAREEIRREEELKFAKAEAKRAIEEEERLEAARIAEEERLEAARIAEERRLAEEAERARIQREEDERRIEREIREQVERQLREAEEARLAEEARKAEEARIAEERRLAEEARKAEEARRAEAARIAEEIRLAEEARIIEEERLAEEARIRIEEARRRAEERIAKLRASAAFDLPVEPAYQAPVEPVYPVYEEEAAPEETEKTVPEESEEEIPVEVAYPVYEEETPAENYEETSAVSEAAYEEPAYQAPVYPVYEEETVPEETEEVTPEETAYPIYEEETPVETAYSVYEEEAPVESYEETPAVSEEAYEEPAYQAPVYPVYEEETVPEETEEVTPKETAYPIYEEETPVETAYSVYEETSAESYEEAPVVSEELDIEDIPALEKSSYEAPVDEEPITNEPIYQAPVVPTVEELLSRAENETYEEVAEEPAIDEPETEAFDSSKPLTLDDIINSQNKAKSPIVTPGDYLNGGGIGAASRTSHEYNYKKPVYNQPSSPWDIPGIKPLNPHASSFQEEAKAEVKSEEELAREREERNRKIQEQLKNMYAQRALEEPQMDDFSDLEEEVIVFNKN